jgi:hypothetical protein
LVGVATKLRIEPFLRIVNPNLSERLDNQNGISFENSRTHGDAMCISNEDRSPARIHSLDAAPTPTGFAKIVGDFPVLHAGRITPFALHSQRQNDMGSAYWIPRFGKMLTGKGNPGSIGDMKTKTTGLILALCFFGAAFCFADDPQMGTWKLNETKSKFAPGVPKNHTVVYEAAGDNVKVTVDGTDKDGKSTHNEWTGKFDGKDYPVTGDPTSDMRSYKKIDDRTLEITLKKGGRLRSPVELWCRPMASPALSPRMKRVLKAKNSKTTRCTTSSNRTITPEG